MGIDHNLLIKKLWISGRDEQGIPPNLEKAISTLQEKNIYIDYLYGRPIKTKFNKTHIVFSEYDGYRGPGALEKIMTELLNEMHMDRKKQKSYIFDGFNLYEH
jgi:hypothetical protein